MQFQGFPSFCWINPWASFSLEFTIPNFSVTTQKVFQWTGACRDVNSPECLRLLQFLHVFASWAGMVDCEGRWWHQKSPYLLCSSGLALAGTWTLRNVWGCCSFCTCLHHGLAWLTVHQKSPYLLCSSGLALAGTWTLRNVWGCCSFCTCLHHGLAWLTVRAVDDTKNHLTYFVREDWHLPGRELSEMSEVAVVFAHVCIMGWHGCLWGPLMTPKITLPTLFEWTGTCRDVNSPKCLRLM